MLLLIAAALLLQDPPAVAGELTSWKDLGVEFAEDSLKVKTVAGPAAKAGVKAGDVLFGAQDATVANWDEMRGILKEHPFAVDLVLHLKRGDEALKLTLVLDKGEASGGKGGKTGKLTRTVEIAKVERTYELWVPDWVTKGSPVPLVLALHGAACHSSCSMRDWGGAMGHEAIVLCPQGLKGMWRFDDGDAAFVEAMIDAAKKEYNVDLRRVWIGGMSMGAAYAGTLGRQHGDRFAAMALCCSAGEPPAPAKSSERKAPVILTMGSEDSPALAKQLKAKLEKAGHTAEYFEDEGVGHAVTPKSLGRVWEFFKKNPRKK